MPSALLLLAAGLAAAAGGSETAVRKAPDRTVILVLDGGGVRPLPPDATPSGADLPDVDHAWVWTPATAPRRLTVDELVDPPPADDAARLRVVVPLAGQDRELPRRVIAAPRQMWEEVPEGLLPTVSMAPEVSAVELPIDPEHPWRLRALAAGRGSWWVDIPAGARVATAAPVASQDVALRVTAAEAGPLVNARISVLAGNAARGDVRKLADLRTGDDGRVVIPALPDLAEVVLLVSAEGHAPASFQGLPSHLAGDLPVRPGIAVGGRFVSDEGLPLTGIQVRVRGWVSEDLPLPISRWRVTGPDGSWVFPSLPARTFELSARAAE